MARSKKIKIKKEEKKIVIDEATKDWNNYIGDLSHTAPQNTVQKTSPTNK